MTDQLVIRPLSERDPPGISAAFTAIGWHKPTARYEAYLGEQSKGDRVVLVAELGGQFVGYVTIKFRSDYKSFQAHGIPEISDLNVLPLFRRRGIATALLHEAEGVCASRYDSVGIGVGLGSAYGAAQIMYARRGYIPDGLGITYAGKTLMHGDCVRVDDDLVLYLTKPLSTAEQKQRN